MSVVVPAHDEEAVIGRLLHGLAVGVTTGEVELVVVCNGCRDRTADAVRRALPQARVVELPVSDKAAALNAGDAVATRFPRFYVDADVELGLEDLRAVAAALADGTLCAAPIPEFVLEGRPWAVRAFYRVWRAMPYLNDRLVGSGVYALSEAGRRRFGQFPALTADDQFVMQRFGREERQAVPGSRFLVHTPTRVSGLIKIRTRAYRGNAELAASGLATHPPTGGRARGLARLACRPSWAASVAAYVVINLLALRRSRRPGDRWDRDESARGLGRPGGAAVGYLVSRYPAVSHAFVLREVRAARSAGLDVTTFTVRRTPDAELLSAADRAEAASTWAIRPVEPGAAAVAAALAVRHPVACWRALVSSVRRAPPGLRASLWQCLYLGEAVLLAAQCRRRGIRHLHAHLGNVAADLAWIVSDLGCRVDGPGSWGWSLSMHGPTELVNLDTYNVAGKVAAATLVLCISDYARSQLMAFTAPDEWSKLKVVHMGVDLDRYPPSADARARRRRPRAIVLCVGRLDPVKGQEVLLEALQRLGERAPHLVLVGAGPAEGRLRSRVEQLDLSDRVQMTGAVGQDDLPALYADADIFCLPSFSEGLPVVLMEAMATELPVVTTTIAGIPELVEDGRSGLLVAPGRPDLLADALGRLVDDPEARSRLGRAGRRVVEADFDASRCGAEAANLIATAAGSLRLSK